MNKRWHVEFDVEQWNGKEWQDLREDSKAGHATLELEESFIYVPVDAKVTELEPALDEGYYVLKSGSGLRRYKDGKWYYRSGGGWGGAGVSPDRRDVIYIGPLNPELDGADDPPQSRSC